MAFFNNEAIYEKTHTVDVYDGSNSLQKKSIHILIRKENNGTLFIKLRDESSFIFNYTASINLSNFQIIKKEQSLDIEFEEFETHLIEMLLLNLNKEMFLKCELSSDSSKCRMIFYGKSKIKNLIFLVIELSVINQMDLFEEMGSSMKELQDANKNLSRQLSTVGEKLKLKEKQIVEHRILTKKLQDRFMEDIESINNMFHSCLRKCDALLGEKLFEVSTKVVKIMSDINIIKNENYLKSVSSARLLQSLENLRIENIDSVTLIDTLKANSANLEDNNKDLQKEVKRLTENNQENIKEITDLQNKLAEYRKDLENSAIVIAKKTENFNELKQDMEQANQVIRNYNKHYDLKAVEVEELKEVIKSKDTLIKEQIFQNNQLFKEFHEYKVHFNSEETDKLLMQLSLASTKIETLEKEKREMVKLNGLLTNKLSATNLFADAKHFE